jgi:hypothetical protein
LRLGKVIEHRRLIMRLNRFVVWFVFSTLILFVACRATEEQPVVEKQAPPIEEPQAVAAPPEATVKPPPAMDAVPSAETTRSKAATNVWAPGKEGIAVAGLDGGIYEAYAPRVIATVQDALRSHGYYQGETHGYLDEETMRALGEFQKEQGIQVCGVPTPRTRDALFAL